MEAGREDILRMSAAIEDLCGLVLGEQKAYLIKHRLAPIARDLGCETLADLYARLASGSPPGLPERIVDAITTHETQFFRDTAPFEALANRIFPELIDAKAHSAESRRIRILSAGCSTGQEPYSVAMVLSELLPDVHSWDVRITAIDISKASIARASLGTYTEMEADRGLERSLLIKHFSPTPEGWKIRDEIRSLVYFRPMNLLEPLPPMGPFDVILCRNVAIYFAKPVATDMFRRLSRVLAPNGYVIVGTAEALERSGLGFEKRNYCRAIYYQLTGVGAVRGARGF